MHILFVGDIGPGKTSMMRMSALERLGHKMSGVNTAKPWSSASWIKRQIQRRTLTGSIVETINQSVLTAGREKRPDLLWAEKQEYLKPETIAELRKLGIKTVHFTPDPYFYLSWKRTRLMDEAMKEFDGHVYCKVYETNDFRSLKKPAIYMPLGYGDETHRPLPSNDPKWNCTLGFLGGWEPRREELLSRLTDAKLPLKIWGQYWDHVKDGKWTLRRKLILNQLALGMPYSIKRNDALAACLQGGEVYADDYARALTGSRIGLGFLRKVCPDQHTTRSFEIPACGSMLLADRTEEHQSFFEEGKEADYFDSPDELLDKAKFYVANEAVRFKVAAAGLERCRKSGYSYYHRVKTAMQALCKELQLNNSNN